MRKHVVENMVDKKKKLLKKWLESHMPRGWIAHVP